MRESKTRKIRVLRHHISEGKCRDPNHCILKLAVAEDYKRRGFEVLRLAVKGNGVVATTEKGGNMFTEKWMIPDKAYKALRTFDKCESRINADPDNQYAIVTAAGVRPFDFTMNRAVLKKTPSRTEEELAYQRKYRKERIKYFQRRGIPVPGGYVGTLRGAQKRLDSVLTGISPE